MNITPDFWTILASVATSVGLIYAIIRNFKNDLNQKIDEKFDKIDEKFDKIDQKFDKVNERIDKLSDKVEDIDRRLCRIEGSLATQGHCLFNKNENKKAE